MPTDEEATVRDRLAKLAAEGRHAEREAVAWQLADHIMRGPVGFNPQRRRVERRVPRLRYPIVEAHSPPGCPSAARVANRFRVISVAFLRRLHAARKVFEQRRNALRMRDTEECHDDECSVRPIKVLVCHQRVSQRVRDASTLSILPLISRPSTCRDATLNRETLPVPQVQSWRSACLLKHQPWCAARHRDQKSSVTAVNELWLPLFLGVRHTR